MTAQKRKKHLNSALHVFNQEVEKNIGFAVRAARDITELINRINDQLESPLDIISPLPNKFYIWNEIMGRETKGIEVSIFVQDRKIEIRSAKKGRRRHFAIIPPDEKAERLPLRDGLSEIAKKIANLVEYDPKLIKKLQEERHTGNHPVDPRIHPDRPS